VRKRTLLFPVLVVFSAVLSLYVKGAVEFDPGQVVRPLLVLSIFIGLLQPVMLRLTGDWDLAGIFLGCLAAALFCTAEAVRLIGSGLLGVAFVWCAYTFLLRRPRKLALLGAMLSSATAFFILAGLLPLTHQFRRVALAAYFPQAAPAPRTVLSPGAKRPDVYFIVVDSYGRADVLQDYYSLDNSGFINYLQSRGFTVARLACTNYPKTSLSVASALNLQYIGDFGAMLEDSPFWWTLAPYIDHSRLRSALEGLGYGTYATASDWEITDNETVDHYYKPYPIDTTEFEGYMLNLTLMGRLTGPLNRFIASGSYDSHRAFIENTLTALVEISKADGPKFVFAHIAAPHPPFVYDAAGSPLSPAGAFGFNDENLYPGPPDEYRALYAEQVQYLNRRLEQVIDEVLANSAVSPIIVLQGDHGPRPPVVDGEPEASFLRERYAVLGAYRLPGVNSKVIPSNVTPVNVFRIILTQYFGAELPALVNANYLPDRQGTLHTQDITARLGETCVDPAGP